MAVVKFAPHIADIRGSIGNATFSANGTGSFLKQRVAPDDKRTEKQRIQRYIHSLGVNAWKHTLTDAQRIGWNNLGLLTSWINSSGLQYHPCGFNLFIRLWNFAFSSGQSFALSAPTVASCTAPLFTILPFAASGHEVSSNGGWTAGKTGYCRFAWSAMLPPTHYSLLAPMAESSWIPLSTLDAIPPNYVLPNSPHSPADKRYVYTIQAFFTSGSGTCVSMPQVVNLLTYV